MAAAYRRYFAYYSVIHGGAAVPLDESVHNKWGWLGTDNTVSYASGAP